MTDSAQFDVALKSYPPIDFDLSTQQVSLENVKSSRGNLQKGRVYNYLSNNASSNLSTNIQQIQIQPYTSVNTQLFAGGNQSYIDFKLLPQHNALYVSSEIILTVQNNNQNNNTAYLCSAPFLFSKTTLLRGGSECLQTYSTPQSNYIETCIGQIEESTAWSVEYTMYGIKYPLTNAFESNVSIAPGNNFTYVYPVFTSIYGTLLSLEQLCKQDYFIRVYTNPGQLLNPAQQQLNVANVGLGDISVTSCFMRINYIEVANYQAKQLYSYKYLNFKAFQRRFQQWTAPSLPNNQMSLFQMNSINGVAAFAFCWVQPSPSNLNEQGISLSQVWIQNAQGVNIFNQIGNYSTQYLNYMAVKLFGGSSFLSWQAIATNGDSQNNTLTNGITYLPLGSCTDPLGAMLENKHEGGYLLTPQNVHSLSIMPNIAQNGPVNVYMLVFIMNNLTLSSDGVLTEESS